MATSSNQFSINEGQSMKVTRVKEGCCMTPHTVMGRFLLPPGVFQHFYGVGLCFTLQEPTNCKKPPAWLPRATFHTGNSISFRSKGERGIRQISIGVYYQRENCLDVVFTKLSEDILSFDREPPLGNSDHLSLYFHYVCFSYRKRNL